jgi:hypothetical protein
MEGLSSSNKRELIENLSKSIGIEQEVKDKAFFKSFGAFGSEKNADEIVAEIKAARKFSGKEIKF